jgi:hypothetical protein
MPSRASTGGVLRWSGLEKASPSGHSHDDRFGQRLATTAPALGLRVLLRKVRRQPQGISENGNSNGLVVATVYHLAGSPHGDFVEFFHGEFERKLTKPGASILASFVTENHPNTFPALAVRERRECFCFVFAFRDRAAYEQYATTFANSIPVGKRSGFIKGPPELLLLARTDRSLLRA